MGVGGVGVPGLCVSGTSSWFVEADSSTWQQANNARSRTNMGRHMAPNTHFYRSKGPLCSQILKKGTMNHVFLHVICGAPLFKKEE